MNWHQPTKDEINGTGEWRFIVDIQPGDIPHQASQDGDALLRIGRHGWTWIIKEFRPQGRKQKMELHLPFHMGEEDTREAAIGAALQKLGELRGE